MRKNAAETAAGFGAVLVVLAAVLVVLSLSLPNVLLQSSQTYDGLYHLHKLPRKRLVRTLSDPIPAFVPSKPATTFAANEQRLNHPASTAARLQGIEGELEDTYRYASMNGGHRAGAEALRLHDIEGQLLKADHQMLVQRQTLEHRGLMANSRHGSSRLMRLLSHRRDQDKQEKAHEAKALSMATADFSAPNAQVPNAQVQQRVKASLPPAQVASNVQHSQPRAGLGALDVVPENDQNVMGSLGGKEKYDANNRDGSLLSTGESTERNSMGALFAVHAPLAAKRQSRDRNAVPLRYRRGRWSRDGLLWIVGDGEAPKFHAPRQAAAASMTSDAVDAKTAALDMEKAQAKAATATSVDPKSDSGRHSAATHPQTASSEDVKTPVVGATTSSSVESARNSKSHLSTGPLSLKRLLSDFSQYQAVFGSFFSDEKTKKFKTVRFEHAEEKRKKAVKNKKDSSLFTVSKKDWGQALAHPRTPQSKYLTGMSVKVIRNLQKLKKLRSAAGDSGSRSASETPQQQRLEREARVKELEAHLG